jgi:hypothetical protein
VRVGAFRFVRSEIFTTITMKNAVFCDMASFESCENLRFGRRYRLYLQGKNQRARNNISSKNQLIHSAMMEAVSSSETSVLTRATRYHISEDGLLHHSDWLLTIFRPHKKCAPTGNWLRMMCHIIFLEIQFLRSHLILLTRDVRELIGKCDEKIYQET